MRRDWMIFAMQVLTAAVTVGLVIFAIRLGGTIRSQWDNTADIAQRETLLGDLNRTIGYGGMIHALKNYVLRGDQQYVDRFDMSHESAISLIAEYRKLDPLSETEEAAMNSVLDMISSYRAAMNTAIRSDLDPTSMDALVRIDDAPTLAAFNAWHDQLESRAQVLSQSEVADIGKRTLLIGSGAVIVVVFMGGWITFAVITARKREIRVLSESAERMELANKAKTDFLANMSHEIRTPMTSIVGFSMLISETSNPELATYSDSIQRNARHLMSIIDDLLDIAVIEAGRLELAERSVSPLSIAEDVRSMLTSMAKEKEVDIRVSGDESLPPSIHADPKRIRQVLLNLAGNSVKFTERGSVDITMRFDPDESREGQGVLSLTIRDTGQGIADEDIERLFSRFEQADGSSTRLHGGIGLGLSISKSLVGAMGGTIDVQSKVGLGSLFTVTIPVRVSAAGESEWDSPADAAETAEQTAEQIAEAAIGGILSGYRILVVEDGPDNRNLLFHFLTGSGATVDFAENGKVAIDLVTSNQPYDVVLMDMQMPVMDGIEAAVTLRSDGFAQPILGLTAHAMENDKVRFIEAGCNAVLTKPVDRARLVDEVRRLANLAA